jgi:hypothetical protein
VLSNVALLIFEGLVAGTGVVTVNVIVRASGCADKISRSQLQSFFLAFRQMLSMVVVAGRAQ